MAMKKLISFVLAFAMVLVLVPVENVEARGGGGRGRSMGGAGGSSRRASSRNSKKDRAKLVERSRMEDSDSLRRLARENRR